MRARSFLMGILVGGAGFGIPVMLGGFGGGSDRPMQGGPDAPINPAQHRTDEDPSDELARLRAEIERLRAMNGRSGVSTDEASGTPSTTEDPVEAVAGPIDPIAEGDAARALELLLAELNEQTTYGLVKQRFAANTQEFAMFVMQTWMQTGKPERALRLLQMLRNQGFDASTAVWVATALKEKGQKELARDALMIGLKMNPTEWSVIQMLADVDPDAALTAQAQLLANQENVGDDAAVQKAMLLLASHRREDALKMIDEMVTNGKMTDFLWDQLVQRDPSSAIDRLRKQIEAQPDNLEQQMRLITAMQNATDRTAARGQIDAVLQKWPDAYAAVQALGTMDRRAALAYLEGRISAAPNAQNYGWYGEQLIAADRKPEAIAAYWQAFQMEPGNGYQYQLLQLAPERFATQLGERARAARDDELLGDIGDAMWREGHRAEGLAFWQEALQFDPGDGEWINKVRQAKAGQDPLR
ncbi:MAG: hypothetical protein U1F36_21010 [Planctomycetota bacterium]